MKRLFILLFLVAISCGKKISSENFLLKPTEFKEKAVALPGSVILDVRSLGEFQQEHIKGAINFDFNLPQFDILIAGLDKSKPYFVYCASGTRSAKAADKMHAIDFQKVYLLDGGIKAWKGEGLEVKGN